MAALPARVDEDVRPKLSRLQHAALTRLCEGQASSYQLRSTLNTLNSLYAKGLVKAERGPGSIWSPRTAIQWSITEAGRAALARTEDR